MRREELKINWAYITLQKHFYIRVSLLRITHRRADSARARDERTVENVPLFFLFSFLFFCSTRRAISTGADDVYPIMHTSPSWPERDRRPAAPKNSSRSPIHKQSRDVIASPLSCTTAKGILERGSIDPRAIPPLHACVCVCALNRLRLIDISLPDRRTLSLNFIWWCTDKNIHATPRTFCK